MVRRPALACVACLVLTRSTLSFTVQKLRKMDAIVHILYEVAGTSGSLLSVVMIKKFGSKPHTLSGLLHSTRA